MSAAKDFQAFIAGWVCFISLGLAFVFYMGEKANKERLDEALKIVAMGKSWGVEAMQTEAASMGHAIFITDASGTKQFKWLPPCAKGEAQ